MVNGLLALTNILTVFKARFVFFVSFAFFGGKVFTVAPSHGFFLWSLNTVTQALCLFIDNTQVRKARKIKSFYVQNCSISMIFSDFEWRTARVDLNSNVYQFYKPKSNCFKCETTVKLISFFSLFPILGVVYIQIQPK